MLPRSHCDEKTALLGTEVFVLNSSVSCAPMAVIQVSQLIVREHSTLPASFARGVNDDPPLQGFIISLSLYSLLTSSQDIAPRSEYDIRSTLIAAKRSIAARAW